MIKTIFNAVFFLNDSDGILDNRDSQQILYGFFPNSIKIPRGRVIARKKLVTRTKARGKI